MMRAKQDSEELVNAIEHRDGYSVEVFFPYQVIDGRIVYGEMFAQPGKHEIFRAP